MGAKCCAPSSCKVRKRLLDEYESQEVYVPSRSVSRDPERRRDSTVRVSVRSEGAANGQIKTANSANGVSLTLPRVKNHTIRSTDTVPIVRVPAGRPRPPSKIETSHVVTGSLSRHLNDVSGKSVVRDSKSGQMMTVRAGSQPPGKVTYQYKVNASERRVEYRYHSETLLYDFEETTKREQLETWKSKKRAPSTSGAVITMVRKTKSLQEQADVNEVLGTLILRFQLVGENSGNFGIFFGKNGSFWVKKKGFPWGFGYKKGIFSSRHRNAYSLPLTYLADE
eukprot:NP_001263512.1 Uncharacterized protein CELE_T02G6.2 [Caenorhabditis elegans]